MAKERLSKLQHLILAGFSEGNDKAQLLIRVAKHLGKWGHDINGRVFVFPSLESCFSRSWRNLIDKELLEQIWPQCGSPEYQISEKAKKLLAKHKLVHWLKKPEVWVSLRSGKLMRGSVPQKDFALSPYVGARLTGFTKRTLDMVKMIVDSGQEDLIAEVNKFRGVKPAFEKLVIRQVVEKLGQ